MSTHIASESIIYGTTYKTGLFCKIFVKSILSTPVYEPLRQKNIVEELLKPTNRIFKFTLMILSAETLSSTEGHTQMEGYPLS